MTKALLLLILLSGSITNNLIGQPDYVSPFDEKSQSEKEKKSVGYKFFLEGGIMAPEFNFDSTKSNLFTSHGIYIDNLFLGIGAGLDRYDTLSIIPIVLDSRFIFTGKPKSSSSKQEKKANGFNILLYFSGGVSKLINDEEGFFNNKFTFQGGLGFLIGVQDDIRLIITGGYKRQFIPDSFLTYDNEIESLIIRLGIEFKT